MRGIWPCHILAVAGVLLSLSIPTSAGEIQWGKSYDEARKAATEKNALVMADFYTDW